MEGYEDDDDTHFCIKCNLTVHGLDNYVRHRRSGCRPPDDKNETVHESPATPTTVSYPEILNADMFFSSLELQSSAKTNPRRAPTLLESSRKFKKEEVESRKKGQKSQVDESGGAKDKLHSMLPAVSDLDDPTDPLCIQPLKQTNRKRQENPQRMEQSWLEDTILADLALENSENKELARYDFEYHQDDDSEDDMLDDDLGEDDSYLDSDDGEHRERPPRDHTGGKWKPELDDLPQDMPHMHEEDVDPEDDHQEHPPPTYTGGKWRPAETSQRRKEESEQKRMKKGVRQREKEIISCEMCHARVKRPQVGKHLLSHYHCRVAGVNPSSPSARRFLLENMANVVRQCPFQCAPCRFYCNTEETFLLHWRSELHVKTLEQIGGSCRCTPCDFWCEDNGTMESHLLSSSHRDVVSMMNGSVPVVISRQRALPCGSCDRQFRYNFQLRSHAKETGHDASYTASDEYQQRIKCNLCPCVVRSLVTLQRHKLLCHVAKNKEKDDEVAAAARLAPYFCSFCSLNFATTQEAVLHRRTSSHKEAVKARKSREGLSKTVVRECPHCDEKQPNLAAYKNHLLNSHPKLCHRCPRCGLLLALSQDVTRHTREGNCTKDDKSNAGEAADVKREWKCQDCTFSTDSQAEFIFHGALHAGAVQADDEVPSSSKLLPKYRCPICKKVFAKASLRNHIILHTGEKPFPCAKCSISFSRRSELSVHQRICGTFSSECLDTRGRRRRFICSECKEGFYTKYSLQQHMLRHIGKKYRCGLPGCPTVLRTPSELKRHRKLVHDGIEKQYQCPSCSYAAKTKTQLSRHRKRHEGSASEEKVHCCSYKGCSFTTKISYHLQRHLRLHTGSKPYKCRHCSYACNALENLRKHVVSTSLHPGKTIYECDFCAREMVDVFCTNFSKELRAHLLEAHAKDFPTPNEANDYVLKIFSGNFSANDSTSN